MRIQLIFFILCFSLSSFASDDQEMQILFNKYDLVMDYKKVELIDEIFTERFIKGSGGKAELIEKIKGLETPSQKAMPKTQMSWKKGKKENFYLARLKQVSANKSKSSSGHEAEFIVVRENGKLKIDGTLSDAD